MDYFSKFLRAANPVVNHPPVDYPTEFQKSWDAVKSTLQYPDERQLSRGIKSTTVPAHLQSLVDALVWESTRTEEGGTGACLEYLLKNDMLGTLVRLSENDRPSGIQAEVLRAVQNMVVLMDEQFLVHSAVHRAVLRLLRNCAGDDLQEQLDGHKLLGAARNSVQSRPSVYEEDLVHLLCILCSRIRTYRELLMIFFHDKHWYQSEPLFSVEELDEDDEDENGQEVEPSEAQEASHPTRGPSPTPSQATITLGSSAKKKAEYEFLLFNYLLRFVHREGQIGDFARAGLLFLMDVAMSPGEPRPETADLFAEALPPDPVQDAALALAEYILDGDFSEVLGAGLGAVYSLLPSKLVFHPASMTPVSPRNSVLIGGFVPDTMEERERQEFARERSQAMGIEDAQNPDFKARLDHFLKLLEFLQDVLRKNNTSDSVDASALVGSAISQSIVDAVRLIFLENVLYPSILECSDADGSAVAVISYIEIMIRTLCPGRLADTLISFLLTEDNDEFRQRQRPSTTLTLGDGSTKQNQSLESQSKLKRRKSSAMALLEIEAPASRKQSDYFTSIGRYTLRDLLLANLKSNSQAATSALQLLQSMLLYHPQLTIERLLIVTPDPTATSFPHPSLVTPSLVTLRGSGTVLDGDADIDVFKYPDAEESAAASSPRNISQFLQPETTYTTHERELGLYLALVSRIDPSHGSDTFSTGYEHYLSDALVSIQNQPSYQINEDNFGDKEARRKAKHRLNVNDPILSLILEALRRFFSNSPDFNIALTGTLAILAIHPDRSLAGWLTFGSNDRHHYNDLSNVEETIPENDDGDDRSIDFAIDAQLSRGNNALPATSMDGKSQPVIHAILHGLVTQLERYRAAVEQFDKFLAERRQGLLFSENITDALNIPLDLIDDTSATVPEPPTRPKPKSKSSATSSLVSFLTPRKSKNPPPPMPATPPSRPEITKSMTSPFGRHYQDTGSIIVEPFIAPIPTSSPWKPTKSTKWTGEEDDVFTSSGWANDPPQKPGPEDEPAQAKPDNVTLSQLLDNVVILEESIKELVAVIHARRSLGIDSVRYL